MSLRAEVEILGVLLDVEGTTTSISFVHDTLFPFARARLEQTFAARGADATVDRAIEALRAEFAAEARIPGVPPEFGDGLPYARFLMDRDRKSTALKALQGLIWEQGYRSGELRAHLFDDVPPTLRHWRRAGLAIRIFSSGSVLAQKLLFSHTVDGDLSSLIDGYHDTGTGPKREPDAYVAIAADFALPPVSLLFLSDIPQELDAARRAGLVTGLMRRPGNAACEAGPHIAYPDFRAVLSCAAS